MQNIPADLHQLTWNYGNGSPLVAHQSYESRPNFLLTWSMVNC